MKGTPVGVPCFICWSIAVPSYRAAHPVALDDSPATSHALARRGIPARLAAGVIVAAAAVVRNSVAAATAAVAEQEQQDDDPPPVVAAEPVADTAVVVTTHNTYLRNFLELHRSFHGIPQDEKCATPEEKTYKGVSK